MTLDVAGLTKTYGGRGSPVRALDGVSFDVQPGEVVALVGNNGAGKSTLMSIVAGLLSADSGTATVMGEETTANGGTPTRHLGLAPQEEAIYPTLSVRKNLRYFGSLVGLSGDRLDSRVARVATELLLSDLLERTARELSGGQRRRLHTGLALMHDPDVLLLDEPTVGVDVDARLQLLQFVQDSAETGTAVLYSTHQMAEVEQLASRAVILDHGRVLAQGSVQDIIAEHSPPSAELRFSQTDVTLPELLRDSTDLVRTAANGDLVVTVRTPGADYSIADLVGLLDDEARGLLISAEIRMPGFENAYVRIVGRRAVASSALAPHAPSEGSVGQTPDDQWSGNQYSDELQGDGL